MLDIFISTLIVPVIPMSGIGLNSGATTGFDSLFVAVTADGAFLFLMLPNQSIVPKSPEQFQNVPENISLAGGP